MTRYRFTAEDCRRGGQIRAQKPDFHEACCIAGFEGLKARHGRVVAYKIIRGSQKKRGAGGPEYGGKE